MGRTRTGGFPIGFRRSGGSGWQRELGALLEWARRHGFSALDLERDGDRYAEEVVAAGFRLGAVDLPEWSGMLSADPARRQEAVARNAAYVGACAVAGAVNHFVVMLPEDPGRPRREVFGYMTDSYRALAPVLEEHGAKLVIEGWPGPGAHCCTPESYRAFFHACPSEALGVNYDPSHLIRMNIDPLRFLEEFVSRVYHVHAKDTEIFAEGLYDYGTEQPATFAEPPAYGGPYWRYTLPGHGLMRWGRAFQILAGAGYAGSVSVELEDANFSGAAETEQSGLSYAARYLQSC